MSANFMNVMNELIVSLILAVIQGITEWFPISSSGHLVLAEKLLSYDAGIMFDVALHFGTLMAVFVYFGKDILDIIKELLKGNFKSENGKLGLLITVATIPAAIVGYFFKKYFELSFESLLITGIGFAITGLILFIGSIELKKKRVGKEEKFGYGNAFLVGCAQALALFPGISRSGSTISSGLLLGLNEKNAMKFSFLMSIPVIFGANILEIGNEKLSPELFWATLVSFVVGLTAMHLLFKYVLSSRKNLRWFGIYALILGIIVLSFELLF